MENVGEKARVEAKALLQYVVTVEGLAGAREGLYQVLCLARSSCEMVMKDGLGKEVCLWDTLYRQIVLGHKVSWVKVKKICDNPDTSTRSDCPQFHVASAADYTEWK